MRISVEEIRQLDRFQQAQGHATRSDAVRALVRAAERGVSETPEVPVSLLAQLESIVEDGWAPDLSGALTLVLSFGLDQLSRLHADRLPALRRAARDVAERRQRRKRAAREGRELLER